jgi:hypothetical protein
LAISDVGTNGKKAWNNVHTTIVISNGRTIAISLADKILKAILWVNKSMELLND